jgi:hypothetical protein
MSNAIPTTPPAGNTPSATSFLADTSGLKNLVKVEDITGKFNKVIDDWSVSNQDIQARAKMWQIRNENSASVNASLEQNKSMLGTVTVQIPTGANGKEIDGWKDMTDQQKESVWIKAIKGEDGYKLSNVKFDKTGGNLACDYMYRFEGMARRNEDNNDTGKSANQTMINNIMTRNSNNFNQESQKFQYEMGNLQSAMSTLQQLVKDIFSTTQQPIG